MDETERAVLAERAHREQLQVIICLLETGETQAAISVAAEGPWRVRTDG